MRKRTRASHETVTAGSTSSLNRVHSSSPLEPRHNAPKQRSAAQTRHSESLRSFEGPTLRVAKLPLLIRLLGLGSGGFLSATASRPHGRKAQSLLTSRSQAGRLRNAVGFGAAAYLGRVDATPSMLHTFRNLRLPNMTSDSILKTKKLSQAFKTLAFEPLCLRCVRAAVTISAPSPCSQYIASGPCSSCVSTSPQLQDMGCGQCNAGSPKMASPTCSKWNQRLKPGVRFISRK